MTVGRQPSFGILAGVEDSRSILPVPALEADFTTRGGQRILISAGIDDLPDCHVAPAVDTEVDVGRPAVYSGAGTLEAG